MNVVAHCQQHNWRRIAFVGATKHAGKTTALNAFVREADEMQSVIGLCSVGLDGEALDTILGVAKPPIYAPEGSYVVSAEQALASSTAGLEWREVLPIDSPLGQVVLCRVVRSGTITLAGIRQRVHVEMAVERLLAQGVDFALVDGAFDRVAAATPKLVDAAVLAVGAIAGKTIDAAVKAVHPFLQRFQLPEAPLDKKTPFVHAHDAGQLAWMTNGEVTVSTSRGALFGLMNEAAPPTDVDTVYIPGAVTDSVLNRLHPLAEGKAMTLIAAHPAQVMVGLEGYRKWFRAGHSLVVWDSLPIAAIACNPASITGYAFPTEDWMQAVHSIVGNDIPFYNAKTVDEAKAVDDAKSVDGGGAL